jgi:hypothetical protein
MKPKSSQGSGHTHSPSKPKKFKQTLSACQKAYGNYFLGQERSSDGGIHAAAITSEVYSETIKILCQAIQNKRHGMLVSGVLVGLLHDNAQLHTAAHTRALLEHFNWELSDQPPHSSDFTPSNYHLLTYLKSWLRSQRFNSNQELEGVKT